jgi:hypothetical protein
MRVITRAADRMLTAFVPKITADAGCTAKSWRVFCYCVQVGNEYYNEYYQTCTTSPTCATYCGSCYITGICN